MYVPHACRLGFTHSLISLHSDLIDGDLLIPRVRASNKVLVTRISDQTLNHHCRGLVLAQTESALPGSGSGGPNTGLL